jgi:CheY-like chemotaxis protein
MPEQAVILLAEDEEDYVLLLKKAFTEANVPNPLHVVPTGQEAMAYLRGEGKYASRDEYPLPDLLLLDIKLPGYNGMEITAWVRSQPGLSALRIIILTSSEELRDINDAYRLGANSFLLKPYDFDDLVHLSKMIKEFWLSMCKCPESFRAPKVQGTAGNAGSVQIAGTDGNSDVQSESPTKPAAGISHDFPNRPVVLIVEDNPLNAELASELLESSGVRVRLAETAEAGIQIARELLPDLILMDISLPGMNGFSATKILKADPATRHLRIVGLSAHGMTRNEEGGFKAGLNGYLTKPIDTRTFAESVKSFLMEKEKKV